MSNLKKILVGTSGVVLAAVVIVTSIVVFQKSTQPASEEAEVGHDATTIRDFLDKSIEQGDFDKAREDLAKNADMLTEEQLLRQKGRIDTLEAYNNFYDSNAQADRTEMLNRIKITIDEYFAVATSLDVPDQDRARAYMSIGFQYSETWSDIELLKHIALKLGITTITFDTPIEQAAVFNELFTRAIAVFPSQDAYLKRAWFNSRLLLTEPFNDNQEKRAEILLSIKNDLAQSSAQDGLRYDSNSKYYNSYIGLTLADILDFIFQEDSTIGYTEVEDAYKNALTYAEQDFLGNEIVQDIIRMNYAASVFRFEGREENSKKVTDILSPVAANIRNFSVTPNLRYEGILVMLREIPQSQNQNNLSIYQIFRSFEVFSDVPPILAWPTNESAVPFVFKLI